MKRIIWGIIKIAIVVGLLVWLAYKFFPETFDGGDMPSPDDIVTEEITEENIVAEGEEAKEETETNKLVERVSLKSESMLSIKERYAQYTQGAGAPGVFTGSLTVQGTAVLSEQLAGAFGEPLDGWERLSDHKKTFWVLSELVKQDVNVDMIYSLQGAIISVRNGNVTFSFTDKAKTPMTFVNKTSTPISQVVSRTTPVRTPVVAPLAKHLQLNPQTVVSSFPKQTSAIYWNIVVDMNNLDAAYKKRPAYQYVVSHY